jgi:hypothetical protein
MPVKQLALASLKELDSGKAYEAFGVHLMRAAKDCLDRPGDSKPRKVTLEIGVVPVLDEGGTCDKVKFQIHASSSLPKHRTRVYEAALRANGMLAFNVDFPDEADQSSLLPEDEN